MTNTHTSICNLLAYEKYIPILSDAEQERLLTSRPSLAQLQEWNERLYRRTDDIEHIFVRAYEKAIHDNGKRKR